MRRTKKKKEEKKIPIEVSDHAIVRYLERIKGIDVEDIRSKLVNDTIYNQFHTLGEGLYPNDELDCKVRIVHNVVVTVVEK